MPQMFPMDWLNQYIYFMFLFYLIILLNFYFTNPPSIKTLKNNFKMLYKTNKLNWKW
uniref:ATP synthase F0 subunit 8 n=1 Tax=Leptocimbex clavicornis TaxID=2738386 RepID=A0A8A3SQ12_9HYME|nr:ATP synthase F0 subunit 8 [Leptocimbex clavicornis]